MLGSMAITNQLLGLLGDKGALSLHFGSMRKHVCSCEPPTLRQHLDITPRRNRGRMGFIFIFSIVVDTFVVRTVLAALLQRERLYSRL